MEPGGQVTVEMGRFTTEPGQVPVARALVDAPVEVLGAPLRLTAIVVGNPHCVAWFPPGTDLDGLPWRDWGAALEVHPLFPNRTNVQFACVAGPWLLRLRIWERGAGETSASGSSACAVAASAALLGYGEGTLCLHMPGGQLQVRVHESGELTLRGPVEEVGLLETSPDLERRLWGTG